jgi:hypothetical protein
VREEAGQRSGPRVERVYELAGTLYNAQLGCTALTPLPIDRPGWHHGSDTLMCTVNGLDVDLLVFNDWNGRRGYEGNESPFSPCQNDSYEMTRHYVVGENWIVRAPDATTADTIATVTGGDHRSVDC